MAGIRRNTRRSIGSNLLPWAPPNLNSPREVTVSDDPASRYIELADGEDLLLKMPTPTRFDFVGPMGTYADGVVTVLGGRNVVLIGGHVIGDPGPITTISAAVATDDTVITVQSTAGYPASGLLRCDGEMIQYAAKTATTFTGCTRRAGFYLDTPNSSQTTHVVGAKVYLGEYSRSALSLRSQTGQVHVEGFRADGFLNDGIRIRGFNTTTVSLQNVRIGPVTNHEKVDWTDGHPDCVQTWGNGVSHLRMSNVTLIAGRAGKGIENAADTTSGNPVGKITMLNTEIVDAGTNFLLYARSAGTIWEVANSWVRTELSKGTAIRGAGDVPQVNLGNMIDMESPYVGGPDFVLPENVGAGYVSPGYVS